MSRRRRGNNGMVYGMIFLMLLLVVGLIVVGMYAGGGKKDTLENNPNYKPCPSGGVHEDQTTEIGHYGTEGDALKACGVDNSCRFILKKDDNIYQTFKLNENNVNILDTSDVKANQQVYWKGSYCQANNYGTGEDRTEDATVSESSQTSNKKCNNVMFYKDKNYSKFAFVSRESNPWIGDDHNDQISSINIPDNCVVHLYADKDYKGLHVELATTEQTDIHHKNLQNARNPKFRNLSINDEVSSYRLVHRDPPS